MFKDPFYAKAFRCFVVIVLLIALAKVTHGAICLAIVFVGCCAGLSRRPGLSLCCYLLLPYMLMFNGAILPKAGMIFALSVRVGTLLISLSLAFGAMGRLGSHRLPIGMLIPYLFVAAISSASGWAPMISFLKIINFLLFLLGLWLGTQNLQRYPREMSLIRAFFMALVVLTIAGSVAVMPFPSISYATSLKRIIAEEGAAAADAAYRQMVEAGSQTLFCGVMSHSQALSPVLALCMGWVLCDMLFVEKRFRWPHMLLVVLAMPLLFKTRSRVALLTLVILLFMIFAYGMQRVSVPIKVKKRLYSVMMGFGVLLAVAGGISEVKNHSITRWIRKTQDVQGDNRSLTEAVTSSRMGKVEENMEDFYRNPLLGSGFQVASFMHGMKTGGFVLSAPVEKGVLPVMVLGETGIVGACCFFAFLCSFYVTASRKRLYSSVLLFTVLLVTNLGEATFFSPGGIGALLWGLAAVGGFVSDTVILYRSRLAPPRL